MSQLMLLNPAKRRRARKSRKSRSPAQRAATARLVAMNRGRKSRPSRRRRASSFAVNPVRHRRARRYRRNPSMRRMFSRGNRSGMTQLLGEGVYAGIGAVGLDVIFGQLNKFLPASIATPVDATGATQWGYFIAKAGVAVGIGTMGAKFLPARYAKAIAVGALTIMVYQIARAMMPASLTLGAYTNPARVANPNPRLMGAYSSRIAAPAVNGGQVDAGMAMRNANMLVRR